MHGPMPEPRGGARLYCDLTQSWSAVGGGVGTYLRAKRAHILENTPHRHLLILPGERELSLDDLVAATDRGILIVGDGSFSIDQQRYNAQFGGQVFYEIKGGKVVGQLKDVAYQIRTPDFWNSLDMLGGRKSYQLGGSFFDGKGQPGQVNAVSHGSPPARFRNVNVINTGRKG